MPPLSFCHSQRDPKPSLASRPPHRWLALAALAAVLGACASKPAPSQPPGVAAVGAATTAAAAGEASPVFYSLVVESRDLGADIYLNDLLIESVDPADRATLSSALNLWVQPGQNRLEIRSSSEHARSGAQHMLRVRITRRSADVTREDTLADFNLVTPDPNTHFAETRTFAADPAPPSLLWTQAKPLQLDDATKKAAEALARDLERAFARKDVDGAAKLLDWKTSDAARAAFRDPELARSNQRESLQSLFEDAGYVVDFLTPENLRFELRAGGRLLSVARPTGPALQARLSQGGRFRLPLLIANVGGVFQIAR